MLCVSLTPGVPIHHSLPGATRVIYLNFLGRTITGTQWNVAPGRLPSYSAKAYNKDGVAGLSASEQTEISRIWSRMAEDFAPFQVDVTTERPATFTSTVGEVLFTESVDALGMNMPSSSGGGVAYMDVYLDPSYQYVPACHCSPEGTTRRHSSTATIWARTWKATSRRWARTKWDTILVRFDA